LLFPDGLLLYRYAAGNLRRLKMVLTRAKKTINDEPYADYDNRTPLHVAASDGSVMVTNWWGGHSHSRVSLDWLHGPYRLLSIGVLDRRAVTPTHGPLPGDVRLVTWTILAVINLTVFKLQNNVSEKCQPY
jgi:hypothetical protein